MIDFGFDKIALIGAVALIVIGPEKLPKVARTVGDMLGKARRYVAAVKSEVNRSIELDELKKMRTQFEDAARNVEQTVRTEVDGVANTFEQDWADATTGIPNNNPNNNPNYGTATANPLGDGSEAGIGGYPAPPPSYQHPKKNWRLKRGSTPQWYKQRQGIRTKALSGAARVARFRPVASKQP